MCIRDRAEVNRPSRRWLSELAAGSFHPSLPALVGTVLVAAVLLLSCVTLLTQDLLAGADCGYFMADWKDDYAYLTCTVLQAARTDSPKPAIALIGASALRESIAGADYLAGLMTEGPGREFRVLPLTAAGLTHWEAAAIADRIAGRVQGMVVLEVSPGKMALPQGFFEDLVRQPRLALDSAAFDDTWSMVTAISLIAADAPAISCAWCSAASARCSAVAWVSSAAEDTFFDVWLIDETSTRNWSTV